MNKTNLLGTLGFTYAADNQKSFTEKGGPQAGVYSSQNTNLTQLQTRLQVGQRMAAWVEPYLFGIYNYDLSATRSKVATGPYVPGAAINYTDPNKTVGKSTYGGGLGLKLFGTQNFSGGLEGSYVVNKNLQNIGVMGNVKYNF